MPAWSAAKYAAQTSRDGHAARNSGQAGGNRTALLFYLKGVFARHSMDNKSCFFCGARAHHTGYIPDHGPIWLCKARCEDRYTEILRDLATGD